MWTSGNFVLRETTINDMENKVIARNKQIKAKLGRRTTGTNPTHNT